MYRYIIVFFKMMSAQSSGVVLTFLVYTCMGERSEHKYGNMKKKLVMWLCYASTYGNMISVYGNMTDFWKRDTSMEIWLFVGNMTHVWKYDIGKYGNMTIFCIYDTIREIWYWQVWKFGNILEMWHKCGNTIHSLGKWEVIFFFCLRNEAVTDGIWIANTQ